VDVQVDDHIDLPILIKQIDMVNDLMKWSTIRLILAGHASRFAWDIDKISNFFNVSVEVMIEMLEEHDVREEYVDIILSCNNCYMPTPKLAVDNTGYCLQCSPFYQMAKRIYNPGGSK